MKHQPLAIANAAAVTMAALFIVCRAAFALFPNLTMSIAQSWFHGLEVSKASGWSLSIEAFILGLITSTTGAWLVGYTFTTVYNYFAKK